MRTKLFTAAALAAAALANSLPVHADSAATPPSGSAARTVEPGKVGPGSENNAVVSPTSPSVPINKQPPPEIPANSSAGSSTGEQGSGPEGTTGPYNPSSPGLQ